MSSSALFAKWDWERNVTHWAEHWSDQAKYEQAVIVEAEKTIWGRIFNYFHPIYWDYVHRECLELNGTYHQFTNYPLGSWYLASGITYEIIYIPVLYIMTHKEFFQHACYKIMFFMGIMDCISLVPNAILAGLFA
ncbi:unnamed protein product, partial [Mesorhabditis belari]|uniref:Uncharacterized protein n=1 Tax=Mesorhabditis belari TaxID=2138241 RepID=A0AAF3EBV9_9BILA